MTGGKRKGAGRKPSPNKQENVTVRLGPQLLKPLDKYCATKKITRSDALRELLGEMLLPMY